MSATKTRQAAFRGRSLKTIKLAESAMEVFDTFDGSMSTRQVFYQLISRGCIENKQSDYDRTQRLLVDLRRRGDIPYSRVVDRTRRKHESSSWGGVADIMDAVAVQYRRNLWADQDTVVMVALEKQALEGIFAEVVDNYGVSLWTMRGYSSEAFAFELATDIKQLSSDGHYVHIAYFGDHDPSGIDVERDCTEKLTGFGARFGWERHGLLTSDFNDFNLVNISVKKSDSRSKGYLARYGDQAAEIDALPPAVLRERIAAAIVSNINNDAWVNLKRTETVERESLKMVTRNWDRAVAAAEAAT